MDYRSTVFFDGKSKMKHTYDIETSDDGHGRTDTADSIKQYEKS